MGGILPEQLATIHYEARLTPLLVPAAGARNFTI
jgi:hypothetical protein